jgi:hypothetical protein
LKMLVIIDPPGRWNFGATSEFSAPSCRRLDQQIKNVHHVTNLRNINELSARISGGDRAGCCSERMMPASREEEAVRISRFRSLSRVHRPVEYTVEPVFAVAMSRRPSWPGPRSLNRAGAGDFT